MTRLLHWRTVWRLEELLPASSSATHCWRWRLRKAGCLSCLKTPGPRVTSLGWPFLGPGWTSLYRDSVCSLRVEPGARKDWRLEERNYCQYREGGAEW